MLPYLYQVSADQPLQHYLLDSVLYFEPSFDGRNASQSIGVYGQPDRRAASVLPGGDGVSIGLKQVRLDYRKLRGKWPRKLIEILELSALTV